MRVPRMFLAVLLVLALPMAAQAAGKAKSIEDLAKLFDSSSCKDCHKTIYEQWEKSHHARSLMGVKGGLNMAPLVIKGLSPFTPEEPRKATIKTFPCFKCHLPQAVTHADDAFAADYAQALFDANGGDAKQKARLATLNISCLVCHNEKAIIHRLELGPPQEGVLYGMKNVDKHPHKDFGKVVMSEIFNEAIMCGQCHGLGPNLEFENPVQCATLYGSYEHNYISKGGMQTCQECHMKDAGGVPDHLIAPDWNDAEGTSKLLAQAVDLDVQTLGYQWLRKAKDLRPMVVVNTKITQHAGHRIPDG